MSHLPKDSVYISKTGKTLSQTTNTCEEKEKVVYGVVGVASDFSTGVADGGTLEIHFNSNGAKGFFSHLIVAGGDVEVEIIENPTVTSNGSELSLLNLNRDSDYTLEGSIYSGPSYDSDGKTIYNQYIPGGQKNFSGGAEGTLLPMIPKNNTPYIVKLTNRSGGSTYLGISIQFEEY